MAIFVPRFVRQLRDVLLTAPADGEVLTYDSADGKWKNEAGGGGGGGAPTTADYLVGTAQAGLSAEIVAGTSPGGELGGTWASPTVDATHSGSSHAATQTAAEATAAAALAGHDADTTNIHGIADASVLATDAELAAVLDQAVILAPASSARNVIQPTAGAVIAAIVKAHAAQSVDIFRVASSGAGDGYLRVGASGAVGAGNGTYDPALYGGYLTGLVLARAGDGSGEAWFYDANSGPVFTPDATQSVVGFFPDVVIDPSADSVVGDHYGIGSSMRLKGSKTVLRMRGYYAEAIHGGLKATGSGNQIGTMMGGQLTAQVNGDSTGDVGIIYGGQLYAIHYGNGTIGELVGGDSRAMLAIPDAGTSLITTAIRGHDALAHVVQVSGAAVPEIVGLRAQAYTDGRAVTLAKGIDIPNVGQHANVVTSYGLYMAAQSLATNVYGIYIAGGKSVFVDSLITGKIALPADADFANGQGGWWWDQANSLPKWKGKKSDGTVVDFTPGAGGGAPTSATYITQTPDAGLSAEQALSALATGLVKNTTGTGVLSIGAEGTDYYAPGGTDVALADGGTGASLVDPGADRIMFWDDSAGATAYLTPGTNLTITGTTIDAAGGGGGIARAYKTGRYFMTVGESSGDASLAPVLDRAAYTPFPVHAAITIDRLALGVVVAGGASSVVRLGIYNSNADMQPGTLLLDAGTISGTSNTYQEITISQALSANTLYWIAVVWQVGTVSSGTLRAVAAGNGSQWVSLNANSSDPRSCVYTEAGVTGALPATATPATAPITVGAATKVRIA